MLALLAVACSSGAPAHDVAADSVFKAELLSRVAQDQTIRDSVAQMMRSSNLDPQLLARMAAADSANSKWIAAVIRPHGFPTSQRVGDDGVKAVLLLIQHADWDPAFQAEMLPHVEQAFRAGDVKGQELAMLTDRVRKAQGLAQLYGTQMTMHDGVVRIDPIEDSATVDARRRELGLKPLAEYKRVLDSVFARRLQ